VKETVKRRAGWLVETMVQGKACDTWHKIHLSLDRRGSFFLYLDGYKLIERIVPPWYRRLWLRLRDGWLRRFGKMESPENDIE